MVKGKVGIKKIAALVLIAALLGCGPMPGLTDVSLGAVTSAKTPAGVGKAHIKWQHRFGKGYANAVTPPLLVGSSMYIGAGGYMYRLNKNTGKVLQKLKVDGVFGYTTIAPAYNGKDKIFVPISEGRIQALALSGGRMSKLWTSSSFGSQTISPILCKGDYIYTGAYGKKKPTDSNPAFVTVHQETGKVTRLAENEGGYYWSGACVTDKYAVFGEEAGSDGKARVRAVSISSEPQMTGTITVDGSVRSTVVEYGGSLFFVSKGKKLYKTKLEVDSGALEAPEKAALTGESTGVPVIHEGRAYVGTSAKKVDVIDIENMKRLYSIKTPAYIQGEMLLSAGGNGRLRLYGAYNSPIGGIYYMEPGSGKAVSAGVLLKPDFRQYCLSPVICDSAGTLYYKNDSGYIMAVTGGYFSGTAKLKVKAGKRKAVLSWKKVSGAEGYAVYRATKKSGKYKKVAVVKKVKTGSGYKPVKQLATVKYTDKKLKGGKKYYYKVRAFKEAGNRTVWSKYSKVKGVKTKKK